MEQRRHDRFKVSMRATVCDRSEEQRVTISCLIRDASQTGCKLVSSRIHDLPDKITVEIPSLSRPIKGTIVWRAAPMAGVKFEWDDGVYDLDSNPSD